MEKKATQRKIEGHKESHLSQPRSCELRRLLGEVFPRKSYGLGNRLLPDRQLTCPPPPSQEDATKNGRGILSFWVKDKKLAVQRTNLLAGPPLLPDLRGWKQPPGREASSWRAPAFPLGRRLAWSPLLTDVDQAARGRSQWAWQER